MKIMVIGSGGREHAIAWKISKSELVDTIFVAPGNAGTLFENKCVNVDLNDVDSILKFAMQQNIDYTIVGPEAHLVDGIVDRFKLEGLKIFGPTKNAAKLEGSKIYAKNFARKYKVQTADYNVFYEYGSAKDFLKNTHFPKVIKADGLAGGKGVFIVDNFKSASEILKTMMLFGNFKDAGRRVIVEEFLQGYEVSVIALIDGNTIIPFKTAMDYKKAFDGDLGPNTGGMGSLCPNPYVDGEILKKIEKKIIYPTMEGIKSEQLDYKGIIYFGIIVQNGEPYLLEYNVRFGDPETQAILPLLKTDFMELIQSTLSSELSTLKLDWSEDVSCCVVAASNGYPKNYASNRRIFGIDAVKELVFHASTIYKDGKFYTNGGRVFSLVSVAKDYFSARREAYFHLRRLNFSNIYYRRDIGIVK